MKVCATNYRFKARVATGDQSELARWITPPSDRLAVVLAALMGLGWASGCRTEEAPPTPSASQKQLGFGLSVLQVENCQGAEHHPEQARRRELGVKVRLENFSEEPLPANFFYARLVDSKRHEIRPHFGACRPYLSQPPLMAAQHAQGWVNFRVPDNATGLAIVYEPAFGQTVKRSEPIALMR